MATSILGRTDQEFWEMTPRMLLAMIAEWNKIEKHKAKVAGICFASYMNGKNPDEFLGGKEAEKVTEDQMQKNARLLF